MHKWVFVFDWDFTLAPSSWNFVRKKYYPFSNIMQKYEDWKSGKLSLKAWIEEDVQAFFQAGYCEAELAEFSGYRPFPGAEALVGKVKAEGFLTATASLGFSPLVEMRARELGIDEIFLTRFEGGADGVEVTSLVDPEAKAGIVADYQKKGFRVVFVGDGDSDIPAFRAADVAVLIPGGRFDYELEDAKKVCDFEFKDLQAFADGFENFMKQLEGGLPAPE